MLVCGVCACEVAVVKGTVQQLADDTGPQSKSYTGLCRFEFVYLSVVHPTIACVSVCVCVSVCSHMFVIVRVCVCESVCVPVWICTRVPACVSV